MESEFKPLLAQILVIVSSMFAGGSQALVGRKKL